MADRAENTTPISSSYLKDRVIVLSTHPHPPLTHKCTMSARTGRVQGIVCRNTIRCNHRSFSNHRLGSLGEAAPVLAQEAVNFGGL